MADPAGTTVTAPQLTQTVDQTWFIEAIGGPQNPVTYLDRFPDSVYNKAIDSRLVKFLYALIGPAGVGSLRKAYLEERLAIEEQGYNATDLDLLYGGAGFMRAIEEMYNSDPQGLLTQAEWNEIVTKDASYRNRAIDFSNGVRMGNTPEGMHLVARSGLGHEAEIIENYRYLFDQHSDDPLGLPHYGRSYSTEEMIVLPRRETSQSAVQSIGMSGNPTGGTFNLFFPMGVQPLNTTTSLAWNVDRYTLQAALEALPTIGRGNVICSGGPLPGAPILVQFTGQLAARTLPNLIPTWSGLGDASSMVLVQTETSGLQATDEVVYIAPQDMRLARQAVDRIRPVTTIPTFGAASGLTTVAQPTSMMASSEFAQVLRYVTGNRAVAWPPLDTTNWMEAGVEHEAPTSQTGQSQHYQGFHNVATITASSTHIGPFYPYQATLFNHLARISPADKVFDAPSALAEYAEPLTVSDSVRDGNVALINGIYPLDYQSLSGVPPVVYSENQFWASVEVTDGPEILVVDLGRTCAVNYLYFEISRKPISIAADFDLLDQPPTQVWEPVTLSNAIPSMTSVHFDPENNNPWAIAEINFTNSLGQIPFTRYIRLTFTRNADPNSPFVGADGTKLPWSIEIRNLRVGRNVV